MFLHIADGAGEKTSQVVTAIGMIISGFAIALWKGWVFALICIAYMPVYVVAMTFLTGGIKKQTIQKMVQNAKLGSFTEEQMSAIKLVISFGREDHALN